MNGNICDSRIDCQVFLPFPLIRQALIKNEFRPLFHLIRRLKEKIFNSFLNELRFY